jgi:hypothetical protein
MTARTARRPILEYLSDHLLASRKWEAWRHADSRIAGQASLEAALESWRRDRAAESYRTVAALAAFGSSRGGNDDDAALAVAYLLQDGLLRIAVDLRDVCEVDDVLAALWEEVKRSAPTLGPCAPRFLLRRAKVRALGTGDGYMANRDVVPLAWEEDRDSDPSPAAPGWAAPGGGCPSWHRASGRGVRCEEPDPAVEAVADLTDLLDWARARGVLTPDEVNLVTELMVAAHVSDGREAAYRAVGQRRGVGMRTIRRHRDAVVGRLHAAAGEYLAVVS